MTIISKLHSLLAKLSNYHLLLISSAVTATAALRLSQSPLFIFPLSVISVHLLHTIVSERLQLILEGEEARRLGAQTIPRIRGWLPGNLDVLWQISVSDQHGYPTEIFAKWAELYGPTFDMGILWSHQIVTTDPEVVKHVTSTQFERFEKGVKWNKMLHNFLGNGIFSTDGSAWKSHRSTARPFFAQDRISDSECFARHTNNFIEVLGSKSDRAEPLDVQDVLRSLTLDITMDFLFGEQSHALDAYLDPTSSLAQTDFKHAFDSMTQLMGTRIRLGASQYKYFEPFGDKSLAFKNTMDAFLNPIVENALASHQSDGTSATGQESGTLIDHLIRASSITDTPMSATEVKDELLNFLLAGRDTSAATITFSIYILTLHPEIAEKLQEEMLQVIGENADILPTHIKRMHYLRAFINEVLRLFTPVPFNIRRSCEATTIPPPLDPHHMPLYMPPRVSISWSTTIFHRRKDIWGDDAEAFDPERWLDEAGPAVAAQRNGGFAPFNRGPRICLGQNFGYAVVSFVLVRILQRFSLELAPDAQPVATLPPAAWKEDHSSPFERKKVEKICPAASLTLFVKGGLWVRVKSRSSEL